MKSAENNNLDEPVNIRGSINCLEVREPVEFPRALCKVSSVRAIAGAITTDTGKTFNVSITDEHTITVTRLS